MILVIFIKAVAELGVIPYTHLFIVNFLLAIKPKIMKKCFSNKGCIPEKPVFQEPHSYLKKYN